MKKTQWILIAAVLLTLMLCPVVHASADSDIFDYTDENHIVWTCSIVEEGEVSIKLKDRGSETNIKIPDKVEKEPGNTYSVVRIADSAFYEQSDILSITILATVRSIGDSAFKNCTNLSSISIPNSVTSIGNSAFYRCDKLLSISIPKGVTSIGDYVFEDCDSLQNIIIPDSVTNIGYGAFANCEKLSRISIPSSVTSIGGCAFMDCDSLLTIDIPDSVTSIGEWAFASCNSLTGIKLSNKIRTIEYHTFSDNGSLSSITIPNGVTSIGEHAFSFCSNLTKVTIPNTVTSIGASAFEKTNLEVVTIPNSVTSIGKGAFSDIDSNLIITLSNSMKRIEDSLFRYTLINSLIIPEGVTSIGSNAFYHCYLQYISLPDSISFIHDSAFDNCKPGDFIISSMNKYAIQWFKNKGFGDSLRIQPYSITHCAIGSVADQTYTGKAVEPKVTVKKGDTVLTEGTDYTLSYANNLNVGTATVTVTGTEDYNESVDVTFVIVCADIGKCAVAPIPDQPYTGKEIKPDIPLSLNGIALKAGTDYTVTWQDNVDPGFAKAEITGKGNFTGKGTAAFTITKADPVVTAPVAKTGLVCTGQPLDLITPGSAEGGEMQYSLGAAPGTWSTAIPTATDAGTYFVWYKVVGDKNHNDTEPAGIPVTIAPAEQPEPTDPPAPEKTDLSAAKIAAIKDQTWTGKTITPKLTVTCNGKSLVQNTDYTVSCAGNKNIGTAAVTITGVGNYTGTKTASFKIIPKKVTLSSLKAGKGSLTVKWKAGKDIDGYEIEYSLKKSFAGAKKITVKKAKTTSYVIKKLQAKKKYYVRIRAFKKVKGKKYYSEWSKVKSKKVK